MSIGVMRWLTYIQVPSGGLRFFACMATFPSPYHWRSPVLSKPVSCFVRTPHRFRTTRRHQLEPVQSAHQLDRTQYQNQSG